jgi:hypothetical protein
LYGSGDILISERLLCSTFFLANAENKKNNFCTFIRKLLVYEECQERDPSRRWDGWPCDDLSPNLEDACNPASPDAPNNSLFRLTTQTGCGDNVAPCHESLVISNPTNNPSYIARNLDAKSHTLHLAVNYS